MRIFTIIFVAVALTLIGCVRHRETVTVVRVDSLKSFVGQRVLLVGVAEPRKLGAALRGGDFCVWIDGLHSWPTEYVGQRVEVVGVLEERNDLPVFVQKPDELLVQGIPVPEDTDLQEASHRYVVRNSRWSVIR